MSKRFNVFVGKKMADKTTGWWREFKRGVLKPSLGGVLGAMVVAVVLLLISVFLITPELMASIDYGYFLASPRDSYAYVAAETLRLASTEYANPSVILVGSSAMREAISDVTDVKNALSKRLGCTIDVYRLTAEGLNLWEISSVVDLLDDKAQGLLVVGISPKQLAYDKKYLEYSARVPRLTFDTQAYWNSLDAEGLKRPQRCGVFFIDHYRFFLARPSALLNLVRGPIQLRHHRAEDWRIATGEAFKRACQLRMRWKETYDERHGANLAVYERMMAEIEKREGLELVLLDAVRNPSYMSYIEVTPEAREYRDKYCHDVETLAKKYGVPYLELNEAARLDADDFVDTSHIHNPEARDRYTMVLTQRLGDMFEERMSKQASLGGQLE